MTDKAFPDEHAAEIADLLLDEGAVAVTSFIGRFADGAQRLQLWSLALRQCGGDVPLEDAIDVAESGIDEALTQRESESDADRRRSLTGFADTMAYNLASTLAPCWSDDPRPREMRHFETGLEAAQLCLQWRQELGRGHGALAMAWWARGAHLLALGQAGEARSAFARCLSEAEQGAAERGASQQRDATGDRLVLLAWGWLALARHRKGADASELEQVLAVLDEAARARPGDADDLRICSDQLRCGRERIGA